MSESQPKLYRGEDLDALRQMLNINTGEACWLYGTSMSKWTLLAMSSAPHEDEQKRGRAKEPLSNISLSLLVRILMKRPELNLIKKAPSAQFILDLLNQGAAAWQDEMSASSTKSKNQSKMQSTFDLKKFSVFFGHEASAGYRWITLESRCAPITKRLFTLFAQVYGEKLAEGGQTAANEFVSEWETMIIDEARSRGVENIFSHSKWNNATSPENNPIIGEDLDSLRESFGLSVMDACSLFCFSSPKWTQIARRTDENKERPELSGKAKKTLDNPTLALYVRALKKWRHACPTAIVTNALVVFDAMKEAHAEIGISLEYKRFAILFGRELSSGYRWMTVGAKTSPALERLFTIYMNLYRECHGDVQKEVELLAWWESLVLEEAQSREINDIFRIGRWVPNLEGKENYRRDLVLASDKIYLSKKPKAKPVAKPFEIEQAQEAPVIEPADVELTDAEIEANAVAFLSKGLDKKSMQRKTYQRRGQGPSAVVKTKVRRHVTPEEALKQSLMDELANKKSENSKKAA